jgi:hypothetical protein
MELLVQNELSSQKEWEVKKKLRAESIARIEMDVSIPKNYQGVKLRKANRIDTDPLIETDKKTAEFLKQSRSLDTSRMSDYELAESIILSYSRGD